MNRLFSIGLSLAGAPAVIVAASYGFAKSPGEVAELALGLLLASILIGVVLIVFGLGARWWKPGRGSSGLVFLLGAGALLLGLAWQTANKIERPVQSPPTAAAPSISLPRTGPQAAMPSPAQVATTRREKKLKQPADSPYFQKRELQLPTAGLFDKSRIEGKPGPDAVLSKDLVDKVRAAVNEHHCRSDALTVYSTQGGMEFLVVSDCFREVLPATAERKAVLKDEFPVVVAVADGSVHELGDLTEFGFEHDSGKIVAVTDMNGNGHLELWLKGAICTCEKPADAASPCNCEGMTVVESVEGDVRVYEP